MIDSVDKINNLAAQAKAKKAKQWETIKTESPDLAEFLINLNPRFGKPAGIRVTVGDKVLIDTLPPVPAHRRWVKP